MFENNFSLWTAWIGKILSQWGREGIIYAPFPIAQIGLMFLVSGSDGPPSCYPQHHPSTLPRKATHIPAVLTSALKMEAADSL
jgi:hypothetical protein